MNRIGLFFALLVCGGADAFAPGSSLAQLRSSTTTSIRTDEPMTSMPTSPNTSHPRTSSLAAAPVEVLAPSYNLALGSLALGAAFGIPGSPLKSKLSAILGGIPLTLFGLFLAFQTTTLRFTFDDDNFALVRSNLESTGENVVVGGENVWAYNKVSLVLGTLLVSCFASRYTSNSFCIPWGTNSL